jgi:hypothetical protein
MIDGEAVIMVAVTGGGVEIEVMMEATEIDNLGAMKYLSHRDGRAKEVKVAKVIFIHRHRRPTVMMVKVFHPPTTTAKTEEVVLEIMEMVPEIMEMVPEIMEMVPEIMEMVPEIMEMEMEMVAGRNS